MTIKEITEFNIETCKSNVRVALRELAGIVEDAPNGTIPKAYKKALIDYATQSLDNLRVIK